jgi:hypothetical protein
MLAAVDTPFTEDNLFTDIKLRVPYIINCRLLPCSRWNELGDAIRFHIELARIARAPTEFRLLNALPPVLIGTNNDPNEEIGYESLVSVLYEAPSGGTPLCRHIGEIAEKITAIAPTLRARGQKAAVVIATDGESSDGDLALAMRPLKNLPVWIIVRLCTDEETIEEYWNNVDKQLGTYPIQECKQSEYTI